MAIRTFARTLSVCMLAIAVVVSGCATHPYVSWTPPAMPPDSNPELAAAVNHAYEVRGAYQKALIAEAERRTNLSNGLIVLGAAVLGMGALKAHRDALVVAGLGGGTAYTLGVWNQSQPREQIYVEAMKALTCAVDAVLPLRLSKADTRRFDTDLKALVAAITKTNSGIATVENLAASAVSDAELVKAAKADVATGKTLVVLANDTYAAGRRLVSDANNAGPALVNTVAAIGNQVDGALRGTLGDLSALPNVIKGLAASVEIFVPGLGLADSLASRLGAKATDPGVPGKQSTAPQSVVDLMRALGELKQQATQLASQVRRISAQIESVNAKRPIESLKTCGVQVDLAIQAEPAQLVFIEKRAETKRVIVSGGKRPYVARMLDTPAPIEVHSPIVGDSVVEVVASDKTVAGETYTVHVMDAAGQKRQVTVVIQSAPSVENRGGGDTPPPGGGAAMPAALNAEQVMQVQRFLCVNDDGKFRDKSRLALQVFQLETVLAEPDGVLSDAEFKRITDLDKVEKKCGADRQNYYEKGLDAGQIAALRKLPALDLAGESGTIDPAMREKIKKFQLPAAFGNDARGKVALKARDAGQLTSLLRAALLK